MAKRYIQAVLVSIGFLISFGIRCNVGVAVVKIHSMPNEDGVFEFQWSPETIGNVDASFFWGYILTQVPGGFLTSYIPANQLFGIAIFLSSCLNMLLPTLTNVDPLCVVLVRVAQGLLEGVTYPCAQGILQWWAPPLERTILSGIILAGSYAGAAVGLPLSEILADSIGWYAPFYFYGLAGLIWFALYLWLSSEKPSTHPSISPLEKSHIEDSLADSDAKPPTLCNLPWTGLLTSMPVYAIILANFAKGWTFYLLMVVQPKYLKERFGVSPTVWSSLLPHIVMTIVVPLSSLLADLLRMKKVVNTTAVRKIFGCGGFGGVALFLVLAAFANNHTLATAGISLAVASSAFAISAINVNLLDIAPRHAAILTGLSNTVGTLAAMLCPIVLHLLTGDQDGLYMTHDLFAMHWMKVYLRAAGLNLVAMVFYAIFASGEIQAWAVHHSYNQDTNVKMSTL